MSRTEVRVVVLFEDDEHEKLMRRLVDRLHLKPVRYERCGDCNGVLSRLKGEVEALRKKKHQKNLGLIAVIDADKYGVAGRMKELSERITIAGGPRLADERIALLIPAWEIETWYVHLCSPQDRPVDEGRDDYKNSAAWRRLAKDLGDAAKQAAEAWMPEPGRVDPPSLEAARVELGRVQ